MAFKKSLFGLHIVESRTYPQVLNRLIKLENIPKRLRNRSIRCNSEVGETAAYLIMECSAFNSQRDKYFPELRSRLVNMNIEAEKKKILGKHLGEEGPNSGFKGKKNILNTIKYLFLALPKRSAIIADLKSELLSVKSL